MVQSGKLWNWSLTALLMAGLTVVVLPRDVPDADAQSTISNNGICEFSETCETDPGDCGVCPSASDTASCPATLGTCGSGVEDCCVEAFSAGTIIIPMDRCHQLDGNGKQNAPTANDAFCEDEEGDSDDGIFEAYGLVYRMMQQDIPVYWAVNPTKDPPIIEDGQNLNSQAYNDRDIDMWAVPSGGTPPMSGGSLTSAVGNAPVLHLDDSLNAEVGSYTFQEFPFRGGAFIIAAADVPEFTAFWNKSASAPSGKDYSGFAANDLYDFTDVELYELQSGAELVYLDYTSTGPSYTKISGAPVAVKLDYRPPRIAREEPSTVSENWLELAKLNDEAQGPECLIGDFQPSTAVYCDISDDEIASGYLIQGQFGLAWMDRWNAQGGTCASYHAQALMTQLNDFMTGIPGLRDGGSVMLMGSPIDIAEQCSGLQPMGNPSGGLATSTSVPTDPMIIRHPQNLFSQFGDLPPSFATGSGANAWNYDPWGYQNLQSLRRLVSADTGTTCSDRISTSSCDTFGLGGDQVDMAAYARYQDKDDNGIIFYMGGQNVTQSGNASHLRMVLNAIIATPQGSSEPPTAGITTEVTRSTPVVGSLDGGITNVLYQGTVDVITPAEQVPTYSGSADDATFEFPYFRGHFRAIDVDDIDDDADGSDFSSVDTLWDAADGIPAVTLGGCGTPFTAACRTIFTTTSTGDNAAVANRPNQIFFNTSNAATLAPLLSDSNVSLSTTDASVLIGRVMAGRDDGIGNYVATLGGVDRSSVAIVEANDDFNHQRPAVAYFGGLDGMVHAVCVETGDNCLSPGQELWAYIPRSQLPLLRLNRQRIDASMTVDEVYGDFDADGSLEYRTILTFQMGNPAQAAGISGQEPGVVAIDVTDPASPTVLWEVTAPATRGAVELGVGLDTAMGQVNNSGTITHTTFVQASNGGTGGPGFIVMALNTATGEELWRYEHEYPSPRDNKNPPVPFNGYQVGVSLYDADGQGYITNVLVPSLYGDVWKLEADTGESSIKDTSSPFEDLPLFRHSVDLRPIAHPPAIFQEKGSNRLIAVVGSGGYQAIGSTLVWSPDSTTQYVVGVDVDGTTTVDETGAVFANSLSSGERVFTQPTVAGNEIFVVTDDANVNQLAYGQSGTNTGTVMRMQLNMPSTAGDAIGVTQSTAVSGGSGSAAVGSSGTAYTGSGTSAKTTNLNATAFDADGADITTGVSDPSGTRVIWLHL